jgi:hypothetical protein
LQPEKIKSLQAAPTYHVFAGKLTAKNSTATRKKSIEKALLKYHSRRK